MSHPPYIGHQITYPEKLRMRRGRRRRLRRQRRWFSEEECRRSTPQHSNYNGAALHIGHQTIQHIKHRVTHATHIQSGCRSAAAVARLPPGCPTGDACHHAAAAAAAVAQSASMITMTIRHPEQKPSTLYSITQLQSFLV